MTVDLHLVAPGEPALAALDQVLSGLQQGDPLAPVVVVVPSNAVGVSARRAVARRRPIGNVQFLTMSRLAEMLGRDRLGERRPVSTALLEGAVRAALAAAPGRFGHVADHPATVGALRSVYRAVRDLPEPVARRLQAAGSPLGREAVRVVLAAHERLCERWYDASDLLREAAHAVRSGRAVPGAVVVHLPERDEPLEVELAAAVADRYGLTVVAARTGDPAADAETGRWLTRLGLPVEAPGGLQVIPGLSVRVVSTSDADDEVRAAVRVVVERLRAGVPAHRIAVVWTQADPYGRLVTDRLRLAGVALHGKDPVSVAERVAGRTVLGLLDVDRLHWRRDDVFAVLAGAPVRLPSGVAVPTAAWERVSRRAGVHRAPHWEHRLHRYAAEVRANAADTDDAKMAAEREARRAEALARFVADLDDDLGPRHEPARWSTWAARTHRLLERYLGDAVDGLADEGERRSFERVQAAVDRLGELDAVGGPVTRPVFREALAAELETDLGRLGVAGTGVLVGPLSATVGVDLDVVVLVGASDDVLPGRPRLDPLLTEADRHLSGGLLPAGDLATARTRRALAATFASVPDVVVTVARGDLRRSTERRRSPWLAELVPDEVVDTVEIPSFGAGVQQVAFPATGQEHRLRSLAWQQRRGSPLHEHVLVQTDTALARARAVLDARRSPRLTAFDGDLRGVAELSPLSGSPLSVTRLEAWATCPYAYLLRHVLRVENVENPDDNLGIRALDRGNLLHHVLDRFHREALGGEIALPAPGHPWSAGAAGRLLAIFEEEATRAEAAGLTGRPVLWRRERLRLARLLVAWLERDNAERAMGGYVPIASEQSFGFDDSEWPAAEVALDDARVVRFRGLIDRVDRCERDGNVAYRVVDHKASKRTKYSKLHSTLHDGGTKLQLLVYAAAVRHALGAPDAPVRAEYSFLLLTGNQATTGYDVGPVHQQALRDALGVIVSGIEQGLFPAIPAEPSSFQRWVECPYCDPDGLGTAAAHRRWLRKRQDPALAPLVALRFPAESTPDEEVPA